MPSNPFSSPMFLWTLFFLFLIVCGTGVWAFVYWWKKDRHTREKFAFLGATALIASVTLLATLLSNNTSPAAVLLQLLFEVSKALGFSEWLGIREYSFQQSQLSPTGTAIYVAAIFGLGLWFFKMFKHWDGQKSKAQYEQEQNRIPPSVISDIQLLLARNKEKLAPYQDTTEPYQSMLEGAEDKRAWHEQARQLWKLHHRQYWFEEEFDAEHKCWWGEEKNTGALACLACHLEMPPESDIATLAEYARRIAQVRKRESIEIILACKNCQTPSSNEQRIGYKRHQTNQSELLDNLIDFSDYFDEICYRVERATLPDSELTLANTYTPSLYRLSCDGEVEENDLETFIGYWLAENSTRQLALLGEYGQGKSTVSLMLSYHLIEQRKSNPRARIPILLELRGKSPRNLTPEELLASWAILYSINVKALMQLLMDGRLLLIFEGFDEIDLTGDTDTRLNHFRTLWRLSYPQEKLLITGRPNFFLDDCERKRALGIEAPHSARPYCQAVFLAPFKIEQIDQSLRNTDAETRGEIIALARQDKKFYEIVSRPSLLFIVSTLWKRENLSEKCGQISSAFVMELFIRQSYRRQGAKQKERNFMALNTAERAYFMTGIAAYMAVKGLPNQISKQQLEMAVMLLIEAMPDQVSMSVGTIEDEVRLPLKHPDRFDWEHSKADVLEHINTDVRACGILVTDLSKDGTFKFAHKSFMEFLQAHLVSQLFSNDEVAQLGSKSILNTLELGITHMDSSSETMSFLAELLMENLQSKVEKEVGNKRVAEMLFDILVNGNFTSQGLFEKYRLISLRLSLWSGNRCPWCLIKWGLTNFMAFWSASLSTVLVVLIAESLIGKPHGILLQPLHISTAFSKILVLMVGVMVGMIIPLIWKKPGVMQGGESHDRLCRRLEMWFRICRDIGLTDEVLARKVGRNIVTMLEKQEFGG